ncbi:serine/threonine-protein kinase VRK1-like [Antedon mediterranea]|uniref:serine/threonine-protein kinase VRK1-like n=1 Tax=Antedon mediterranea TaxID=105859 RepID=UPI003AF805CB
MPGSKAVAAKPKKARAYKLPKPLPEGEILTEHSGKRQWRIGSIIGQGGFGYIYLASDNVKEKVVAEAQHVLKIEPQGNGPLFVELHFYQRAAKEEMLEQFRKSHKLPYVGVPKFISTGLHETNKVKYRFMVMQRFGEDLYKKLKATNQRFTPKITYMLAKRILNTLEYLHENGYIHADIKAANLMMGHGPKAENQLFLVDYGLAYRYKPDGTHKPYKEDPRKAHDGTLEYTSRDAHKGVVPSRRADIEILGYNILHWLSGKLPWDNIQDPDKVSDMKQKYMLDVSGLLGECFGGESFTGKAEVEKYLKYAQRLKYEEKPDYVQLRKLFEDALKKNGLKDDGKFSFESVTNSPVKNAKSKGKIPAKRKSEDVTNGSPRKKVKSPNGMSSESISPEKRRSPRKRPQSKKAVSPVGESSPAKRRKPVGGTKRKITSSSSDCADEEPKQQIKKQAAAAGNRRMKKASAMCSISSSDTSTEEKKQASPKKQLQSKGKPVKKTAIKNSKRKKMIDTEIQTSPGLLLRYIESRISK